MQNDETITAEHLKRFIAYLRSSYKPERKSGSMEPLSTAFSIGTGKRYGSFYKWGAVDLNLGRPDLELKMPLFTNKEIVPLTNEEVTKLLRACENKKAVSDGNRKPYQCARTPFLVNRDKALILMLLDTGVRSGECARLRIKDVNLETGEVVVIPHHVGKTRPRFILGKIARKWSGGI